MNKLGFAFRVITGDYEKYVAQLEQPVTDAATAAMDAVAQMVKENSRADIARAGFGRRWQNALRVNRYPKGRGSMSPAVYLHHKIQYAGVFEEGATIKGNPLLWVPLSSTPPRLRRNMMTARRLHPLLPDGFVSFKSRTGTPLLGATVRLSRTQAAKDRPKVTLAALKRGKEGTGVLRTLPLFSGVRVTQIRKQLNIRAICERARDQIPRLYAQKFNGG